MKDIVLMKESINSKKKKKKPDRVNAQSIHVKSIIFALNDMSFLIKILQNQNHVKSEQILL